MLAKNMGLFWDAEVVYWGKRKSAGELRGLRARARRAGHVNFWDQVGIYTLYADYDLVYVGQTDCLGARLRYHRNRDLPGRWNKFSWFGLRAVTKKNKLEKFRGLRRHARQADWASIMNVIEAVLIAVSEPPLNKQGGKFKGIELYVQDSHPNAMSDRQLIEEIKERLSGLKR